MELSELAEAGEIRLGLDRKWRSTSIERRARDITASKPIVEEKEELVFRAVPGRFARQASSEVSESDGDIGEEDQRPDPAALLRYYRAAVRSDPRGALTEVSDSYGTRHILVSGQGAPLATEDTSSGIIRIERDRLPPEFREALQRRDANENALAIGWPLSVGRRTGVPVVQPVGLAAGEWRLEGPDLVVEVTRSDLMANPDWLRAAARGSGWSGPALEDLFRGTEGVGLSQTEFLLRLKEAQATALRTDITGRRFAEKLDLGMSGIFDALGLYLPTEASFTAGAVRNLDEIATWDEDIIRHTALAPFLQLDSTVNVKDAPPINVGPINREQIAAVRSALSAPLTVVTGPPGTGKSQAIVAMVASALMEGETVLVASKNHQALDAVEDRLGGIAKGANFAVRTLDPATNRDFSIGNVLDDLVAHPPGHATLPDPVTGEELRVLAEARMEALDQHQAVQDLRLKLAERVDALKLAQRMQEVRSRKTAPAPAQTSFWARILRMFSLGRKRSVNESNRSESPKRILGEINGLRRELKNLGRPADPVELTEKIAEVAPPLVAQTLKAYSAVSEATQSQLQTWRDDLELEGSKTLTREMIDAVLEVRPMWLASVLGTPKRIPLHPGLFDLVIFDEASQCDIGTALPLLARAKRAVVVGDDKQLRFISQIGAAQDRNLMAAQGLPLQGMGRYAQGRKSLFDFASSSPGARKILLRDQYRSAPDIVDYISGKFYGGKLRAAADPKGFKVPKEQKMGLHWTDVAGRNGAAGQGNVNPAEVAEVTRIVTALLMEEGYVGSIGVVTPFRPQMNALNRAIRDALPEDRLEKAEFRVSTVDGWQGQERDLMIFSPVVHETSAPTAQTFLQKEWRRLNVAVSRARAVCHIVGDLRFARSGKIRQLAGLADRAVPLMPRGRGETRFDSEWERIVYHALRDAGLDPQPQYEIAGRRLDFALFSDGVKLDLEVDGRQWHQDTDGNRKIDDLWRDAQLKALGWRVCRFWVDEIQEDLEGCIAHVKRQLS